MYQHGQRLADIVDLRGPDFLDAMALQAKSYLAAINALSLVDQRNAWVQYAIPSGDGSRVSLCVTDRFGTGVLLKRLSFSSADITTSNPFRNNISRPRVLILMSLLFQR